MNIEAQAVSTIQWLASLTSIAVPVFQRDYRWSTESCAQLLRDIRRVGSSPGATHFIGSVLVGGSESQLVLVDGQQRVTTITLLLGALKRHAESAGSSVSDDIASLLMGENAQTRLRPHPRRQGELDAILRDSSDPGEATALSGNFAYFVTQTALDWEVIWEGMQRLEHVVITLQEDSNAQQVFESLNSTAERLSDSELIHNYLHMGRSYASQLAFEAEVWNPLESLLGDDLQSFWRDYLIYSAEVLPSFGGDFALYREFRTRYVEPLQISATETARWLDLARCYAQVLDPEAVSHADVALELRRIKHFGSTSRPYLMGIVHAISRGDLTPAEAARHVSVLQTLHVRRSTVHLDVTTGHIFSLCRDLQTEGNPLERIIRLTPEDVQVRLALTHGALPQARYVLGRLQGAPEAGSFQVEHIYPQTPSPAWRGGPEERAWGDMPVDEQAEMRVLLGTLGNLTLLEDQLNQGAGNRPFADKATYYRASAIGSTRELASVSAWGSDQIRARTAALIPAFLAEWSRPDDAPMEMAADLIRVVDLPREPGMGNPRRYEFAQFRDEMWGEATTIVDLAVAAAEKFLSEGWDLGGRDHLGALVEQTRRPRARYRKLSRGRFLYTGWAPQYILESLQNSVRALGLDDEFRVKLVDMPEAHG